MVNWLNTQVVRSFILSCFLLAPVTTLAEVDLVSETTFYKFDEAWLEISGVATNSVYTVATLYVKHVQKNTQVERLLYIPVNVRFSSSALIPFHITNTWTVSMDDLEGKKLSELFSTQGNGLVVTAGSIGEDDGDNIYVIYSDREIVGVVDLKTVLDIPL